MSSILGIAYKNLKKSMYPRRIKENLRGKDKKSLYKDKDVFMWMTKLSPQTNPSTESPLPYVDRNIVVYIDGTIINKYDIIEELERKGVYFESESDEELIAKLYRRKGLKMIDVIDGYYIIVVYDKKSKKIAILRDPYGVKSLYYMKSKTFYFANRIEYLIPYIQKKEISKRGVEMYISLGHIPSPYTILKGVNKMKEGEILIYDIKKDILRSKRAEIFKQIKKRKIKNAEMEIDKALSHTLNNTIESYDEGLLFSGDIETTAILSKMIDNIPYEDIHTFSIIVEDDKKIGEKIKDIANMYGAKAHIHTIKYKEFKSLLEKISNQLDEPFSNLDIILISKIFPLTVKYTDILFTGFGSKEILGNKKINHLYRIYNILPKNNHIRKALYYLIKIFRPKPFSALWYIKELCKINASNEKEFLYEYFKDDRYISDEVKKYIENQYTRIKYIKNNKILMLNYLVNTVDNEALFMDKLSQREGIEIKHPFLSKKIMEISLSLPLSSKVGIVKKNKLLTSFAKKRLPKDTIYLEEYDLKYNFELNKALKSMEEEIKREVMKLYNKKIITDKIKTFYETKVFTKKSVFWETYMLKAHILYGVCKRYTNI